MSSADKELWFKENKIMSSGEKQKPIEFSSKELMLTYAKAFAKKKFGYDLKTVLQNSKLLHEHKTQKKLWEF